MQPWRAEAAVPLKPANQNGSNRVIPLPLSRVDHPRLKAALRAWDELTEGRGYYDRSRRGFGPLLAKPELMNDRSAVIVCESDDPLEYLIAYYGGGFGLYKDVSLVARRMRDLPDRDAVLHMVAAYKDVIRARRPLAHRVFGKFGGIAVTYDRLVLPTVGDNGEVDRLITLSAELERQPEPA